LSTGSARFAQRFHVPVSTRRQAALPCFNSISPSSSTRAIACCAAFVIGATLAVPVAAQDARDDPGNWTMAGRDYASTRYSPLDQLDASNVGKLALAFTFSTGVLRGHEAAPIVAENTIFIITPFPNVVYALDLTQPGAPIKWKFSPYPASSSQGEACCDVVNRGVVYANGRIYFNTLDDKTIALDAKTGKQVW